MKALSKIMMMALLVAGTTACSDSYLDTTSKSTQTDENYYKTVSDAESALIGCYDGLQQAYCYDGANFLLAAEMMSDNCFAGAGTGDDTNFQAIDRFDVSYVASNNIFESQWKYYYTALNRINTLISKEEQIDWDGDEETRQNIMGQARALRACCYFDLTRLFGSVPLLLEPSIEKVAEATPAEIFAAIAEDLVYAADNINFGAYDASEWESTYSGLISEWSAKALLGRVYLFYTGFYGASDLAGVVTKSEALSELEDVISNGNFALLDDFSTLWPAASRTASTSSYTWTVDNYAGEANQEVVFSLKFDSNSDQGTNQNGVVPMMSMRNTYMAPYGKGWGACTVNPKLYAAYDDADTRRDASIIDLVGEGVTTSGNFDTAGDWREYTGYTPKKYSALCYYDGTDNVVVENSAADFQYYQGQDIFVVRYSDVLLMAAELGSSSAQSYYNQVRTRAGLSTKTVSTANILEERRLEFAFEGIRYWDLLRQGLSTAASTLVENQDGTDVENGGVAATIEISLADITEKGGLCQKPLNQITLTGTDYITQNTGW